MSFTSATLLASLSACCGVAGTGTVRTTAAAGVEVFTITTRGVELRTNPGSRGCSLGWRRTTLVYPAGTVPHPLPRRVFGWCALPSAAPLFVQCSGAGLDFALEPSYWGFSAGRYSRSSARLPLHSSAVFQVLSPAAAGPAFSYHANP